MGKKSSYKEYKIEEMMEFLAQRRPLVWEQVNGKKMGLF